MNGNNNSNFHNSENICKNKSNVDSSHYADGCLVLTVSVAPAPPPPPISLATVTGTTLGSPHTRHIVTDVSRRTPALTAS